MGRPIHDLVPEGAADQRAFEVLPRVALAVAVQPSALELSETMRQMRGLKESLVSVDPIHGPRTSATQAFCKVHRISCTAPCSQSPLCLRDVEPERSIMGSKRGSRETGIVLQRFDEYCHSPILEEPSEKRSKCLRHKVPNTERTGPGESGDGGSNLKRQDWRGEEYNYTSMDEISAVNSCKEKSQCIRNDNMPMPNLAASVPSNEEVQKSVTPASWSTQFDTKCRSRVVRRISKKKRSASAKNRVEVISKKETATGWDSIPTDVQENILHRLEFRDLFRFKILSKSGRKLIESDDFSQSRGVNPSREGSFTAINYYIKNNAWQCSGFDLHSNTWRALPTFSCLPPPDAELFKEYSLCGHGGLMCAEVSKSPRKGELVVFNPLTGKSNALPPLLHPRNPVLVHISVNSAEKSYKVIVAGSSTASDEHLSKKMEVFDSSTSEWKETRDLPGPAFGLNEHQAGVCLNGTLFLIAFLEGDSGRGVVAFDVENEKWLENKTCPIPFSANSNTLQLVESDGKLYLFSEQECGASVEHCIHELEFPNRNNAGALGELRWRNVVRVKKSRGLLVYPEHSCVGFGDGKLCIFNTLNRDGVVYDIRNGKQSEVLDPLPPAHQKGENFFSLNPASFTLQPRFDIDPTLTRKPKLECRCKLK